MSTKPKTNLPKMRFATPAEATAATAHLTEAEKKRLADAHSAPRAPHFPRNTTAFANTTAKP